MCRRATCGKCGKPTWSGCGRHVDQALADVPHEARCRCREQEAGSLVRRKLAAAARTITEEVTMAPATDCPRIAAMTSSQMAGTAGPLARRKKAPAPSEEGAGACG